MRKLPGYLAVTAGLLSASTSLGWAQAPEFVPVTDAMLAEPDPADWLHMNRTYDQQRFSPLDLINTSNVGDLRMEWGRGLPPGTQESVPIVYQGVMYLIAPGDHVMALDATNGELIWERIADYEAVAARSKSLGIYEDMVFHSAFDGFIRALDARTGEVRWEHQVTGVTGDRNSAGGILVADGKVLSNRSCDIWNPDEPETTGRKGCYILALDARTGEELWRFHTTAAPDTELGQTWPSQVIEENRVAAPWGMPGSYDPELRITYWGVADPKPYTRMMRYASAVGLNDGNAEDGGRTAPTDLFSNSTVAINIDTGELAWYFQGLPGDSWDADHNQERILLRTPVNPDPEHVRWISPNFTPGEERDIVVYTAEGGGMFVTDRATGEFLWARPFPFDDPNINMNHIEVDSGATYINWEKVLKADGDSMVGCYHNTRGLWSTSYNPETNSLYVPFHDQCLTMAANFSLPSGWGPRTGIRRPDSDFPHYMGLAKVDMETGEMEVLYSQPAATNGNALTTAGDLVFNGDLDRRLRAFNAEDGTVLWEQILPGMIMNSTITYAVDGRQYVMVFTGEGRSVTTGPLGLTRETVSAPVRQHNAVYVFALPQES